MVFLSRQGVLALVCLSLSACLPTYLVKSSYNQIQILNAREPITEVLKRPDLPADQRHKLEMALLVREFAEKQLGLKATENYKTYVDLKRPYVSWIVSAASREELKQRTEWYPIVGRLPYKGFFSKAEAESEATDLKNEGFDTLVRGVSAYSTLGWFEDPLLSSMLGADEHNLVNVIIHESTHATLYIKSQAEFNERLATFVAQVGTKLFYEAREGATSVTNQKIQNENLDELEFSKFISESNRKLKDWYQHQPHPIDEGLRQKQFALIKTEFTEQIAPRLKTKAYARFAESNLNNAILLYYQTYVYDLSDFERLFRHFKNHLPSFLAYCRSLEKSADPNLELKNFLSTLGSGEQTGADSSANPMSAHSPSS